MNTVFDENDALERTAGDRGLLAEVIRFTLEDIPGILDDAGTALADERWHDASRYAHKAKGSAGACGARTLYLAALDLELAAHDGDEGSGRLLAPVREAFEAFRSDPAVRELASLDAGTDASIG